MTGQRIGRVQEQSIATEAIFWRKYLLWTINIVMTLARFDPVLQDLLQTTARTAKYLNATIHTESVYSMSVNGVNAITQHAISFTLFGTLVIFETPHYDYFVTGQTGAPNEILGVFDWASSVTYVLTDWTFLTILRSTGTGNEAM